MKKIVTGILAHVDSGKTTLSEAFLYHCGEIRKLGRVDHKDAFLDNDTIERERGITIFSKQARLKYKDTNFILLDTPGHVDFSTETERTLSVLDYAILVISATDGVQTHTETLWELLLTYDVPVFLFINKMDISGREKTEIMSELKEKLGDGCIDFSEGLYTDEFCEEAAMCSETLMERYLENNSLSRDEIKNAIKKRKIFPCCFGSALKLHGIEEFMDVFEEYTLAPKYYDEFGAKVFKISEDDRKERLTHMKITGGVLRVKDEISSGDDNREKWSEKVNRILLYSGSKAKSVDEVYPGEICTVTGLSKTYPGEGIGEEESNKKNILQPVLSYKVDIKDGTDLNTALKNLKKLEDEEPELHIMWNEQLQEIHLQLMGEVQLEVLKRIVKERFNLEIGFDKGSIAYKETIKSEVEGMGHYEPLRHYAEVHLVLTPGKEGSGLKFRTNVSEDELDKNWQRLILTHLEEKRHLGVLTGSPITDMTITLVAGRAHKKHTEGGDFRQATYRAVRHGLRNTESVLLEPWYSFKFFLPHECTGRAMNDIQNMSGTFMPPEIHGDMTMLCGEAPVSEMRDYFSSVVSYTGGKGRLNCTLSGYKPCHNTDEVIAEIKYDCDGDTENTADSVFCSHGAGYTVKWDEAAEYMHVKSGYINNAQASTITKSAISDYIRRTADDSELLKIFERTYGPIKRDSYGALDSVKKKSVKPMEVKYKNKPNLVGPEYLLIDGYNVIFSWDELKNLANDSLESARDRLTERLCNYRGFKQCEIILVFDAYKVKGNKGEVEEINNIKVVYTKEAETADTYIEKVSHKLSRKHRVRVVTSDMTEQLIILGNGANRVSAREFLKEIENCENAIRDFLKEKEHDKNTIMDLNINL